MRSLSLITLFMFIISIHNSSLAKVNSEFTKTTLGRKSIKPFKIKSKKRRKLYLNFSGSNAKSYGSTKGGNATYESYTSGSGGSTQGTLTADAAGPEKIGFTNEFQIGYSNSAYRYAGENYPSKSVDFGLVPAFETTCFTLKCVYSAKILGGFDLNNNSKNELALFQLGLKFPGDPWGGYLAPAYSLLGYLPATPKEINDDLMLYGFGGAFGLATTPELMGSDTLTFTGSVSLRKNIHKEPLVKQTDWTTRQALITDLKFTNTISSTIVFAHIYSIGYDKAEKEITEMIQALKWQTTDWLELSVSHSNIGPLFRGEGTDINTDLVSIDNSVLSFAVGFTNSF